MAIATERSAAIAQAARLRVALGPSEGFIYVPLHVARKLGYFAAPQSLAARNRLTNYANGSWQQTLMETNVLSSGSRFFPREVELQRGTGRMSELLKLLGCEPDHPARRHCVGTKHALLA